MKKIQEIILNSAVGLAVGYGVYDIGHGIAERNAIVDTRDTAFDQFAAAEADYEKRFPDSNTMPVSVDGGPVDMVQEANKRQNEIGERQMIDGGVALAGLTYALIRLGIAGRRSHKRSVADLEKEDAENQAAWDARETAWAESYNALVEKANAADERARAMTATAGALAATQLFVFDKLHSEATAVGIPSELVEQVIEAGKAEGRKAAEEIMAGNPNSSETKAKLETPDAEVEVEAPLPEVSQGFEVMPDATAADPEVEPTTIPGPGPTPASVPVETPQPKPAAPEAKAKPAATERPAETQPTTASGRPGRERPNFKRYQ